GRRGVCSLCQGDEVRSLPSGRGLASPGPFGESRRVPRSPATGGRPMLQILGSRKTLCNGLTRRDFLAAGGLALAGLGTSPARQASAAAARAARAPSFGKARSVILLFLYGGASQLETFDVKPEAPVEIRGGPGSMPPPVPGSRVGEGLPRLARVIDRSTVVRSLTHPYPIHGTAYSVTSNPLLDGAMQDNPRDLRHWPFIGSVV